MRSAQLVGVLALAVSLLVGGCASAPDVPSSSTTSSTSTTSSGEPSPTFPTEADVISLTGMPIDGVEPECLLLDGYLLIGGPREVLSSGQQLTVTGVPEPDLMTTCQQGIPFRVETAEPVLAGTS